MATHRFTANTGWKDLRWEAGQEVGETDFPAGTTLFKDFVAHGVLEPIPPAPEPAKAVSPTAPPTPAAMDTNPHTPPDAAVRPDPQ